MHLLGYNLLRGVMAEAAYAAGLEPWQVSFKGTMQTLNQFLPTLRGADNLAAWCAALLTSTASHAVGNRPDRFAPRTRKRRPKNYVLLTKPRRHYKTRRPVLQELLRIMDTLVQYFNSTSSAARASAAAVRW